MKFTEKNMHWQINFLRQELQFEPIFEKVKMLKVKQIFMKIAAKEADETEY